MVAAWWWSVVGVVGVCGASFSVSARGRRRSVIVAVVVGIRVARAAMGRATVSGRTMGLFVAVGSVLAVAVASRMPRRRGVVVVWRAAAVAAYRRRRDSLATAERRRIRVGGLDGRRRSGAAVGAARIAIVAIVVAVVGVVPVAPWPRLHALSRVSAHRRPGGAVPTTAIVRIRVVGGHGYG